MTDSDRKGLQQSMREIRESALGVISGAEAEIARLAHRVLDTVGVKGEGDAGARIRDTVGELVDRVKHNRAELERRVDEGVRAAVARVGRPIADELEGLRGRLEKVQHRVEELTRRRPPPAP